MQDLLTVAATAVEIAIALLPVAHLASKLMPRRNRVCPGQLELPLFNQQPEPKVVEFPGDFAPLPAQEPDPWEAPVEATREPQTSDPKPEVPVLYLLPPAKVEQLPDPWDVVEVEPMQQEVAIATVAPLQVTPAYLRLLPPAKEQPQPTQRLGVPADKEAFLALLVGPDFDGMTPKQLRDECQRRGIKWRNCYGKNRHMPVKEMRDRLKAVA